MLRKIFVSLSVLMCVSSTVFAAPKTNASAPDFTLSDQNGDQISLHNFSGKIVVLEWFNPECPFVKRHYESGTMKNLVKKYQEQGVVWLGINSTHFHDVATNRAFAEKYDIPYPMLSDQSGATGKAYGAKTTPYMVVIDSKGNLAYHGAIDSDKWGEASSATNYVDLALSELTQGKKVSKVETNSYGCSVKYAAAG
ncbi:MAG: redoxin domain-containing protein [Bdellovibrionales bacterium]|nr:redoxin domain-containing protein [Bdellovibrionales bacterium]